MQSYDVQAEIHINLSCLALVAAYPDDAEITFQTAVVHDNLGLERESIPFYVQALAQELSGPDLERCLLGLGSTYRGLGEYQQAEETLRRGVREFPHVLPQCTAW